MVMEVSCNVPAQARDVSQMVSLSAEEDATAEMAADENGKGSIAVPSLSSYHAVQKSMTSDVG